VQKNLIRQEASERVDRTEMTDPLSQSTKQVVAPKPGELITSLATGNTYTMGDKIGEGGFGEVFGCTDVWEHELAAKVLKPTASYEAVKARAEAEVHRLVALRHPCITYIYDAFEYRDTFYIVTERCHFSGHELFQVEAFDGKLWVEPIARSILQAVYYLHGNNYVHQDIHLGNIFAQFHRDEFRKQPTQGLQFKLADLGIARLAGEVHANNTRAQWMLPPEVLSTEEFGPVDHRVDIYHLGLLLLQLGISREITFSKEEVLAGRPREIALQLPAPLSLATEKALRRHVQYRSSSAMEIWRDLQSPVGLPAPDPGAAS
jgi:serine/threonine protein kinase